MPTLNWIGKEAVVNHHQHVPFQLLKNVPELACGDPGSGNLIVQGDNLVALKALLPYYAGQVKCIYIDPPYNTGNEGWVYNDNTNSPLIREWLGKVVGKEAEDLSRHDKWLCMMYPRLALLRQFLREDGSIWISMDDNELAPLRFLLDEIFGLQNFVAQIEWQKRYTRSNNTIGFTTVVEHIVVYRRSEAFTPNLEQKGEEADARYRNPDNDPRGPWKAIPFLNPLSPRERPNLCYDIIQPNTGKVLKNTTKAWRASSETFDEYLSEKRLWWGGDGKSDTPSIKRFLSEVRRGMPPINFWSYDVAGHTDTANAEIKNVFGEKVFDTPKPTQLLQRIFEHATNPGDLILDSFAGSGTTGHAVLNLNAESMNHKERKDHKEEIEAEDSLCSLSSLRLNPPRRFILVEMEPKIARDITAERVRRVAQGYTNAKGEKVEGLGGGFRFCELGEPLFDANGQIKPSVHFADLARHVYFTETGEPLPRERVLKSPLIGECRGVGIYLLFNGILGDKRANGGNILTRAVLAQLPKYDGQKVIYCTGCLLGKDRLQAEKITIRQTPYEIKVS
jgi:site-specific DNA-methyltransferase (adenine-specific)/adenine-specific DNA-methyltransferase